MKIVKSILSLLICMTFAACESIISYSGAIEPEKLVLNCEYSVDKYNFPIIYLSHSFFKPTDASNAIVDDATVEIRVADGEWQIAEYNPRMTCYIPISWTTPNPGERVDIRASHPEYDEIFTSQIVPPRVKPLRVVIKDVDVNGLVICSVTLPPYIGDIDDVIGLRCHGLIQYYCGGDSLVDGIGSYLTKIYSLDPIFGKLNNACSPAGYYGASSNERNGMLFLPASELKDSITIELYADREIFLEELCSMFIYEDLFLEVYSCSAGFYRYTTSLHSYLFPEYELADPHGMGVEIDMDMDVEQGMRDISLILGGQESFPVFSNIQGGIGHFGIYAYTYVGYGLNAVINKIIR